MRYPSQVLMALLVSMALLTLPHSVAGAAVSHQPSGVTTAPQTAAIIQLSSQLNPRTVSGRNRREVRRNLVQQLRSHADAGQRNLRARIEVWRNQGRVARITPLWIMNAIAITADAEVLADLARQPGVAAVLADVTIAAPQEPATNTTPEPNLNEINAPALWGMGYYGQGVVVASLDTGVDVTHPDLAARWRGGANSWFDPYGQHPTPADVNGHGTWTMGVIVGGANSGTAIGVAPQATWIAAKIFNDSGTATTSAIHQAYQWTLDPDSDPLTDDAPDIVNNSWTMGAPGCDLSFEADLQALVTAGIAPVFAAGNFGPGANSDMSPANNPSAISVGAINSTGMIYSGSSRGPTSCGRSSSAIFPDLVAPGVTILTSDLYGGYYMPTGTSLAAPHVSGGLALLTSALGSMSVTQQRAALLQSTTDLGTAGADNIFGAGRIDLLAAYHALTGGATTPTPTSPADGGPPTATTTPLSSTATSTQTETPTNTAIPPTATSTFTNTPIPPTATNTSTNTPLPPTATNTPVAPAPTATSTRTNTPLPPTPTSTPLPPSPSNTPPVSEQLFADGFESGTTSAWSATGGGTRLQITTAAALMGAYGLQATFNGTTAIYVADRSPAAESAYRARFMFDPNSVSLPSNKGHDLMIGRNSSGTTIFRIQIRNTSGMYKVRAGARSGSSETFTAWYTISDARHMVDLRWEAATGGGSLVLSIDGVQQHVLSGLANSSYRLEEVRLGAAGAVSSGISGSEYFDAFYSTRGAPISP